MLLARSTSSAWSATSVLASSSGASASIRAQSIATLPLPTITAVRPERSNSRSRKSGWPLYQATNSVAGRLPGRSSPGNAHVAVGLRAAGIDDRVIAALQLGVLDVGADRHVAEEPEPGLGGRLLEHARHRLDVGVVGRHAGAHQPPGRGQRVEHVDLGGQLLLRSADGRRRRSRTVPSRRSRRAGAVRCSRLGHGNGGS